MKISRLAILLASNLLCVLGSSAARAQQPAAPQSEKAPQAAKPDPVPAEYVYRNIQTFRGLPVGRVLTIMDYFREWLGVDCLHCHTQYEWEKDDKPPKPTARRMLAMVGDMNKEIFGGPGTVSCWTCHRGAAKPVIEAEHSSQPALTVEEERAFSSATDPASNVYRNIQNMRDLPAGRLRFVMVYFRESLGVGCDHCHVPGQWDKDEKPAKQTARKMLTMMGNINKSYTDVLPSNRFTCWGCHRSAAKPETWVGLRPKQ